MKRRDFLAIIPSISTIPIIGTGGIVQRDNKIEIIKPEILKLEPLNGPFDLSNCKVHFVKDGRLIAEGVMTQCTTRADRLEIGTFGMDDNFTLGPFETEVEAIITKWYET